MSNRLLLFILFLLSFQLTAYAQLPGPDSSFGLNGATWRNIYPTDDQAFALALRPDGRAVVVGRTTLDSVSQMAVFQFLPDGKPDGTFHWNSKAALPFNDYASAANAVALDADGRMVLAGYTTMSDGERFRLLRLLPDGSYDPAFGTGGQILTDFGAPMQRANALVLQPDGKIVAAGFVRTGKDADFALARYLPDGTPDPSFGTNGLVTTKIDTLSDVIWDITLQSNGRIVVCGSTASTSVFNSPSFFAVARYMPDGKLDPTFGGFGTVVTDLNADEESDIARSITTLSTGFIVVAGYSAENLASKISVVRYRPSGQLDSNFGTSGIATLEAVPTYGNFCTDIKTLPGDQLLLTGMAENVDFKDVFLIRLLANGTRDASFGQNGQIIRSLSSKDDNAAALAVRPDGRILVAGDTRAEGGFYTDATLLQFNADGSKDVNFGKDGAVIADLGTSQDFGSAIVLQPDGKIMVGGRASNDASNKNADWALLRFKANGQPDSIFGVQGIRVFDLSSGPDHIVHMIRQPTGKIVVGGNIGGKPVLVRFDSEGNIDNSFGSLGKVFPTLPNGSFMETIIQQDDGKLLAVVSNPSSTAGGLRGVLFRYSADGQPDTNFGQNGKIESQSAGQDWTDAALLPDGRILAAGIIYVGLKDATISRFLPDGTPDVSFGQGGTATFAEGVFPFAIKLQKDGKAIVVGSNKAMRLDTEGKPDPSFGVQGIASIEGDWTPDFFDLEIQEDKRILLIGKTYEIPENRPEPKNFLIARLNADGSRDNSWGENGLLRLRGTRAQSAALDPDGNILAVGSINNGEQDDIVVYRLLRGEYVGTVDRPDEAGNQIVNVFPNPVHNQLTLEYDLLENQSVDIQLYDMNGRLLHTLLAHSERPAGKNAERLQLPDLATGMYTIVVQTAKGSISVQVVK